MSIGYHEGALPKDGCEKAFMQAGKPPGMIMLEGEKKRLLGGAYFRLSAGDPE